MNQEEFDFKFEFQRQFMLESKLWSSKEIASDGYIRYNGI